MQYVILVWGLVGWVIAYNWHKKVRRYNNILTTLKGQQVESDEVLDRLNDVIRSQELKLSRAEEKLERIKKCLSV